ncbi:MAG: peptidase M15 [Bacteroidetes bacterium MedPE-SWsnd-G2]|nr:MAG: peptidase M15 [Bacteroidetes bacterium MedPE-SWsnd-G2]
MRAQLPEGFVYAEDWVGSLIVELRYFGTDNFVGRPIEGYRKNTLIISKPTAMALSKVQDELINNGYCLKVFDGYRPQQAVNYFVKWAKDLDDTINKKVYYPKVLKRRLFAEGYIASKSGHSRGSTLDLTIVDAQTGEELDMGSPYDFFGEISWVNDASLSLEQKANRTLLQKVMAKHGFRNYPKEWWHFTLRGEPFPSTYFNFPIE